jgi:hypothetical protein
MVDPTEIRDRELRRRRRRRRVFGNPLERVLRRRARRRILEQGEPSVVRGRRPRRRVRRPEAAETTAQVNRPERRTSGGRGGAVRRGVRRLRRAGANLIRGRRSRQRT